MLLTIKENGQYRNLDLKENTKTFNPEKNDMDVKYALDGESVILEKTSEGKLIDCKGKDGATWTSALCNAIYEGEEISFFLNEKQYDAYSVLGGIGDKVKVSGESRVWKDKLILGLNFSQA